MTQPRGTLLFALALSAPATVTNVRCDAKPIGYKWTLIPKALLVLAAACLLAPQHLWAQQQQPATCTDWTAIQSWSGTITVSGAGQATDQFGNTFTTSQQATIHFTASSSAGANQCGPQTLDHWDALGSQASYSVTIHDTFETTCVDSMNPFVTHPYVVHYDVSNGSSSTGDVGLTMNFGQATPTYGVGFRLIVDNVVRSSPGVPACNIQPYSVTDPTDPWGPGTLLQTPSPTSTPLPATVSPLIGSASFQSYDATFGAGSNATWTISWSFTPVPDVDVVVKIPNYDIWRPTAGRSETEVVGDFLIVQAQLVQKSTSQPAVGVIPDKWSFSLVGVSHEPGVAMNWPAPQNLVQPSPPDMTFNKQINSAINPNLTISDNDTLAEILNPSQTSSPQNAEVILIPFDWGGWATLNVTATVNGSPIPGHFQGDSMTDILLPKRQPGSFVADCWKDAGCAQRDVTHKVPLSTPDSDDSESNPQGDGQPGDGLTLYEEYRGFYMGCSGNNASPQPEGSPGATCQHVEGDPTIKDFFVVDQIGSAAELQIALFGAITNLNVHYRGLTLDDVGPAQPGPAGAGPLYRAINFNFSAGPHEGGAGAYQHAVVLEWGPPSTAITSRTITTINYVCLDPNNPHSCPALPGLVDHIEISPNFAGATSGLLLSQFRNHVTHELGHSVNVYHHGDVGPTRIWLIDKASPPNVQEYDPITGTVTPVTVMTEDQNPSSPGATRFSFSGANAPPCPPKPALAGLNCLTLTIGNDVCVTTGILTMNGLHSGDQNSVMRYYNAQAYIPLGFPTVRIWIGFEEALSIGQGFAQSLVGTGVNRPGRVPRPRYGDAYGGNGTPNSGRGDDAFEIDVNDNHAVNGAPPIIRPIQPVCP